MPLLNEASNVYLGTQPVGAIYRGDVKVWPPPPVQSNYVAYWNDWDNPDTEGYDYGTWTSGGVVQDGMLVYDWFPDSTRVTGVELEVPAGTAASTYYINFRYKAYDSNYAPGDRMTVGDFSNHGFIAEDYYDGVEEILPIESVLNGTWHTISVGPFLPETSIYMFFGGFCFSKTGRVEYQFDWAGLFDEAGEPVTFAPGARRSR